MLSKGAMDVAPDGGAVFEEVLRLPPVERAGGLECLLEVLMARTAPTGLRPGDAVGQGHHLLPAVLPVLVLLVAAMLGRGGVITAVPTAKVVGGLGFATEVGLDGLLAGGILGGNV